MAEFEKTAVTVFLMCVFNGNGRIILLCFELPEVEDPRRWQVVTGAKKAENQLTCRDGTCYHETFSALQFYHPECLGMSVVRTVQFSFYMFLSNPSKCTSSKFSALNYSVLYSFISRWLNFFHLIPNIVCCFAPVPVSIFCNFPF